MNNHLLRNRRPLAARTTYRLAVPIILAWLAVVVALGTGLPPLEQIASEHAVSLNATDAPSFKAALRVSESFKQTGAGNPVIMLLEGEQPLGDDAHEYYNRLIENLRKDSAHVDHIQIRWRLQPLLALVSTASSAIHNHFFHCAMSSLEQKK